MIPLLCIAKDYLGTFTETTMELWKFWHNYWTTVFISKRLSEY